MVHRVPYPALSLRLSPYSQARLVIVAGPASYLLPTRFTFVYSPLQTLTDPSLIFTDPHIFSPLFTTPLFYLTGPACHCGRSRLLPSSYPIYISLLPFTDPHRSPQIPTPSPTFFPSHLYKFTPLHRPSQIHLCHPIILPNPYKTSIPLYLPIGPACHCGRSRHFSSHPCFRPGLSLWQVPPSLFPLSSHLLPPFPSLQARLGLVAGPPCSFSSVPPPSFLAPRPGLSLWQVSPSTLFFTPFHSSNCLSCFYRSRLLSPPVSSCHPARAGRHGRSKEILLPLCQDRSTSDLIDTSSSWTTSFFHWRVWLCFILQLTNYTGWTLPGCASPWLATGHSWNATLSPSSSFTSPSRTEWILRGL